MRSSQETNQRTGPLGDVVRQQPAEKEEVKEAWLPVQGHLGYVKSTKTGAIKPKDF